MNIPFLKKTPIAGLLFVFALGLSACDSTHQKSAQNDSTTTGQEEAAQPVALEVPDYSAADASVKSALDDLAHSYLKLKDALVKSNGEEAGQSARELEKNLRSLDASKLTPKQKSYFDQHAGMVKQHASAIAGAGGVEDQRGQLAMLSSSVFALVKVFGANDQTVYYQYCPMANGEKGAYWLSETKEIKNPYMGEKMLTCGETRETVSAR